MSSEANKPEPFGYFRATPFGWEDCAQGDDGAQALYDDDAISTQAARIASLEAERDQLRAEVERLRGERMGCPPEGYQLVPHEPTDALLRPFYNCPPDELQHAWSAALRVARVAMYRQREAEEHARAIEAAKEA